MASAYNTIKQQQPWALVAFDPAKGWPTGPQLYYECGICHDIVPSTPPTSMSCSCGNVAVDIEYGRCGAMNPKRVQLLRVGKAASA